MKIGILTMFYNSYNYGGILQAYALTKYLNKSGYDAEQICYDRFYEKSFKGKIYSIFSSYYQRMYLKIKSGIDITQRENVFKWGLQNTCHSSDVYNKKTIHKSLSYYDVYIAGSDQIWSNAFSDVYLLSFVPQNKVKLAYSASMECTDFSGVVLEKFRKYLPAFQDISLREKESVKLINDTIGIPASWCVDPTFLLTSEEWDAVTSPRIVDFKYVFCYFLGSDEASRKIAQEYASYFGFKIVTFPYLQNRFEIHDNNFGDIQLFDSTPSDFLSLIKNADMVITDSFHATVFSIIFNTKVFIFKRSENDKMVNRLKSLTELANCPELFCDTKSKKDVQYMLSINFPVCYEREKLNKQINESIKFIKCNLDQSCTLL